jgi:peptidoglycan/xylan/chitin deacetylase (PgdA/CDA1 family)
LTNNSMDTIRLSVVIPTFNRRHVLERTLPLLLAQDFLPEDYELIYVLDGSTDGTAGMLRALKPQCSLQVLEQPNQGPSAARNKGVQAARGDLVLFLDDDILCPPGLFRHHSAAHAGSDSLVVHGPIYVAPDSPPTLIRYITEAQYEDCYRHADPALGLPFPMMASSLVNSSMPRKMLLASGGFNEEIRSAEDMELGLRLWKAGTKFRLLPTAVTQELFVKSSHAVVKQQTKISARGELYVCRKHPEYRPHSGLARIGLLTSWKQALRNMTVRSPLSPVPLLTLPIWLAERLSGFIPIRKAGIRLLEIAAEITLHRAALQGTGSWKALQREFGMRLPALMYHHVGPSKPGTYPELTVSPQRFERQIHWLARRGFVGIHPADWVEWLRTGKGLPDKPVLVTFDDGYADLAEFALPVLRRYGFGAVVFVVTGLVGRTNAWDEARGSATHRLLTAEQIRYWATQGIEFAAHSRTHTDLTTLSADELAGEVVGSRDDLAKILGSAVTSFAYPYGSYNQAVYECARGAYRLTFRADEKTPGISYLCTDPYDLQRTMVHPEDGLADLECRVRWGHSPIQEMRERLRLRSRLRRVVRFFFGRSR